jgi:hypothetical protein
MRHYATVILVWVMAVYLLSISSCSSPQAATVVDSDLPWKNREWSSYLESRVRESFPDLLRAQDINKFCPRFRELTVDGQIHAWAHLIVAIAKFESGYKAGTVYKESTGVDSIGLFQLSYGDRHCPKNKRDGDLTDPKVNIRCAVKIMAGFVAKDGVVAEGGYIRYGAIAPKGLARYWSVVRAPDKKSGHHLAAIRVIAARAPGC